MFVHVAVALFHRCSVGADSDCNTVVKVLCVRSGCAGRCWLRSWAGVQCRAAVVRYTVLTSVFMFSVVVCLAAALCVWMFVSMQLVDF